MQITFLFPMGSLNPYWLLRKSNTVQAGARVGEGWGYAASQTTWPYIKRLDKTVYEFRPFVCPVFPTLYIFIVFDLPFPFTSVLKSLCNLSVLYNLFALPSSSRFYNRT